MSNKIGLKKTDSELIRDFKNGDINGFNEIVRKYQQQVYWIIRKMVQNHDDADDLTQEVFIKVHSAIKEFREESNLFTWLYRIAVNYSINHLRKVKIRNTVSFETIPTPVVSGDKHSDETLDEETKRKIIEEAIKTLPARQKVVFNLRYYEELTYEEISQITKKSIGGLKANYFHAVKKIGAYLKQRT